MIKVINHFEDNSVRVQNGDEVIVISPEGLWGLLSSQAVATHKNSEYTLVLPRAARQIVVRGWCIDCFGVDETENLEQRGIRFFEEAVELAQACDVEFSMLQRICHKVYKKPPGELAQEIGGVLTTLLALGAAAKVDVDQCELAEMQRVLAKSPAYFHHRNMTKSRMKMRARSLPPLEENNGRG